MKRVPHRNPLKEIKEEAAAALLGVIADAFSVSR
jgi:hypothetical protein